MKQLLTFLIIFGNLFALSAQNTFEKGSYVDKDGNQISGLILDIDWLNNPTAIIFKPSLDGQEKEIRMDQMQGFEITGVSRYERHTVQVDRSSDEIDALGTLRAPEFQEETAILQIIADGAATLYEYSNNSLFRYFYKTESQALEPLIYKRYTLGDSNIKANNRFQQQLTVLSCDNGKLPKTNSLRYSKGALLQFFDTYNACHGNRVASLLKVKSKMKFNLKVLGGVTSSSTATLVRNTLTEFPNEVSSTVGFEVEGVLPFNNNKWSFFAGMNSLNYKGEAEVKSPYGDIIRGTRMVDFAAINMSLGARHYMFITPEQKVFINVSYGFELTSSFDVKSTISTSDELSVTIPAASIELGIGYAYKRISLEARYIFQRDHLSQTFVSNSSEYTAI
ncbi:MAG: hypothetical protein ACI86L_001384, partial [Dokdonia sp.]